MDELKPHTNTGVIDPAPPINGWVAGAEDGVGAVVSLEVDGQYDTYLPDEETQVVFNPFLFDTFACVSFSALNNVEILINRLRAKKLLPVTHETFLQNNGYINKQTGKVNLSDRFTAKMSGTTMNGNNFGNVAESIRELHGVLPEMDWPFPDMTDVQNDGQKKWERYYMEVPQDLQKKAKKFLEYFDIKYRWITTGSSSQAQIENALKNGPLQIVSSICSPWSSNDGMPPIPACGCGTGHATTVYGSTENAWKDFDHYKSFRKLLARDYCIPYTVQFYINPKSLATTSPFSYNFKVNLKYGAPAGSEVKKLQEALQYLKDSTGKPYMAIGVFGPFGPATKVALGKFQTENKIVDPDGQGTNFGPSTRAKMNSFL